MRFSFSSFRMFCFVLYCCRRGEIQLYKLYCGRSTFVCVAMTPSVNVTDVMNVLYSQSLQSSIITPSLTFIAIFLTVVLLHDALVRSKQLNTSWWSMLLSLGHAHEHLPSPPGPWWNLPLLGYLPWLGPKPYVTLWNLSRCYGNVFQIRFGGRKVVVLNGRETIRQAFVHQGDTFAGRPDFPSYSRFVDGRSLTFNSIDPDWITHRKVRCFDMVTVRMC